MTGAQDPAWFKVLNSLLSDTNEVMDGICSNTADTSLSSRMDEEDNIDTLENGEQTLEHSAHTKLVTRPHDKRTAARSQL